MDKTAGVWSIKLVPNIDQVISQLRWRCPVVWMRDGATRCTLGGPALLVRIVGGNDDVHLQATDCSRACGSRDYDAGLCHQFSFRTREWAGLDMIIESASDQAFPPSFLVAARSAAGCSSAGAREVRFPRSAQCQDYL